MKLMKLQNIIGSFNLTGITRDDYQLWSRSDESLIYSQNMIGHVNARNYYEILNNLTKVYRFIFRKGILS